MERSADLGLFGVLTVLIVSAFIPSGSANAASQSNSDTPTVRADGESIYYTGRTNQAGLEELQNVLERLDQAPTRFVVDSGGGSLLHGIRIGVLVHSRDMHVVVTGKGCASSCANYIFVPASRKTIDPDAVVLWHYSCPRQFPGSENLRRAYEQGRVQGDIEINGVSAGDSDQVSAFIASREDALDSAYEELNREHDALFRGRGIDERILCLGDHFDLEPKAYTLTIQDMERFGVCNVHAHPDYAETAVNSMRRSGRTRSDFDVVNVREIAGFLPEQGVTECSEAR